MGATCDREKSTMGLKRIGAYGGLSFVFLTSLSASLASDEIAEMILEGKEVPKEKLLEALRAGTLAFGRMKPVEFGIQVLVYRVVRGGDQAQAEHRHHRVPRQGVDLRPHDRERRRHAGQHEDVLDPVVRPRDAQVMP